LPEEKLLGDSLFEPRINACSNPSICGLFLTCTGRILSFLYWANIYAGKDPLLGMVASYT
jgi:hypothetical protein